MIVCDRCGKPVPNTMCDISKVRVGEIKEYNLCKEYDLCNECKKELHEWIKSKKESEYE